MFQVCKSLKVEVSKAGLMSFWSIDLIWGIMAAALDMIYQLVTPFRRNSVISRRDFGCLTHHVPDFGQFQASTRVKLAESLYSRK